MFVLADVGQPWSPPAYKVGDIKMFRNLEQRDLMQFVDCRKCFLPRIGASVPHHRCRTSGVRGANLPDCRCRDVLKHPKDKTQSKAHVSAYDAAQSQGKPTSGPFAKKT
jgi:hypothetical protein